MDKLSKNLFELRRKKGATQKQVATEVGVTPASISAFEKGTKTPQLETAIRLATYFDVSMDVLCGITREEGKPNTPVTKADVFKTLTTLCEYPLYINLSKDTGDETISCGHFFDIDVRIVDCQWLYEVVDAYNSILKLCKAGDIPWEALYAWKERKVAELNEALYIESLEDAREIGW